MTKLKRMHWREANLLLEAYNEYVQIKGEEMRGTGWCPVCVEEFAESEYYENWLKKNDHMTLEEAARMVLELAEQATLEEDQCDNDILLKHREDEISARKIIEDFFARYIQAQR